MSNYVDRCKCATKICDFSSRANHSEHLLKRGRLKTRYICFGHLITNKSLHSQIQCYIYTYRNCRLGQIENFVSHCSFSEEKIYACAKCCDSSRMLLSLLLTLSEYFLQILWFPVTLRDQIGVGHTRSYILLHIYLGSSCRGSSFIS